LILITIVLAWAGSSLGEDRATGNRLKEIESLFNNFNKDTLDLADDFYDPDVIFLDPVVELRGRDALKAYYAGMYDNVTSIRFDFSGGIEKDDEAVAFWTMEVRARGLKGGEPLFLEGASHIRFGGESGKAVYHRDYFDMGAFVYENIPVLGSIIRYTKGRLARRGKE
jgi:ketosteroid isomerase-like protein